MSDTFSSESYNNHQVYLNNLDWGNRRKEKVPAKKHAEKVFEIRLVDKDGERIAKVHNVERK